MNKNYHPNISGDRVEVKNSGGFLDKTREVEITLFLRNKTNKTTKFNKNNKKGGINHGI